MDAQKILIVDDDGDTRQGLNVALRSADYETAFAEDGVTAVSTARTWSPDLIILDLGLPGGDGFTVLGRLKAIANLGTIPVIVLSARPPFGNKKKAIGAGAAVYLQKPVENDELLTAIQAALPRAA